MVVKELIEELQKLPNDMEVKMFLPIVEDWVDINIDVSELNRLKREVKLDVTNKQNKHFNEEYGHDRRTDYTIDDIKEDDWELYDYIAMSSTSKEEYDEWYEKKNIALISNVLKGKSSYDRMGEMEY